MCSANRDVTLSRLQRAQTPYIVCSCALASLRGFLPSSFQYQSAQLRFSLILWNPMLLKLSKGSLETLPMRLSSASSSLQMQPTSR
jgi:hypothetical protein